MAQYCFRNIHMLEELHGAGKITQEEMKGLMIDVVFIWFKRARCRGYHVASVLT
jgi:hypothetical protein